jgi:RimJ/RimL family protein N-acetyltransferase
VTERLAGDGIALRRANAGDLDFLASLAAHVDVEPYLAPVSARGGEDLLADIERSEVEPSCYGRFVVEIDGEVAGALAFEISSRHSRIVNLSRIMVHPDFRGRGVADAAVRRLVRHLVFELGYHRVQLECYGFNERAMRHFERVGFVREGVRRRAYWRDEQWVDGVIYGLTREDLEQEQPRPSVARERD